MLAEKAGFSLLVVQGMRTFKEQDSLYNQGRSKRGKIVTNARGGQSFHNYGVAADFCFIEKGEPSWEHALYKHIGVWAKAAGLDWGGNWKSFGDLPHVELKDLPSHKQLLKVYNAKGMQEVWRLYAAGNTAGTYTVQKGDTVSALLRRFGLTLEKFYELNGFNADNFDPDNIRINDKFIIQKD